MCRVALSVSNKYDNIASDERGRQEALQSWYQLKESSGQIQYTQQVDVYAFAITMFEMLNHQPPWDTQNHESHGSVTGITPTDIYRRVSQNLRPYTPPDVQNEAPNGWFDLMNQCWDDDAKRRPSFNDICTEGRAMQSRLHRYPAGSISSSAARWFQPVKKAEPEQHIRRFQRLESDVIVENFSWYKKPLKKASGKLEYVGVAVAAHESDV